MITRSLAEKPRAFDRISKMMEEVFGKPDDVWAPVVDVKETPEEFVFVAELPGIDRKDIDVELKGGVLTIRGHREFSEEETKDEYVRIERGYGKFQRSFALDIPVKADAVDASFVGGLLKVTVRKVEDRPVLKIPIKES